MIYGRLLDLETDHQFHRWHRRWCGVRIAGFAAATFMRGLRCG